MCQDWLVDAASLGNATTANYVVRLIPETFVLLDINLLFDVKELPNGIEIFATGGTSVGGVNRQTNLKVVHCLRLSYWI